MIDGILLLDKPLGLSSNTALQHAKRLLGARKAGHGGTLDPLASGLLPLLFGEATKFAQFGLDAAKEYEASIRLGTTTVTGDAEGTVLARSERRPDDATLAQTLTRFQGEIEQVPPMYSALKHQGQPLYRLARSGREVERAPRRVTIHELEFQGRDADLLRLRVRCSKGTYIRQLAVDLGEALGCGAHLAALRRTGVGAFTLDQACTFEALEALDAAARAACLLPAEQLVQALPRADLADPEARRFLNGQTVPAVQVAEGQCRVYAQDRLLGIGRFAPKDGLRPVRLVARD